MNLNDLLNHTSEWLKGTGPHSDIVISSRIRLARNLEKVAFPHWADKKQSESTLRRKTTNPPTMPIHLKVVTKTLTAARYSRQRVASTATGCPE